MNALNSRCRIISKGFHAVVWQRKIRKPLMVELLKQLQFFSMQLYELDCGSNLLFQLAGLQFSSNKDEDKSNQKYTKSHLYKNEKQIPTNYYALIEQDRLIKDYLSKQSQILMDKKIQINVALVSDFYYPAVGGVELQIAQLAKYLQERVRKVIVITHCVTKHKPPLFGRQVINGIGNITTYYLPWHYSSSNVIYPTFILEYLEAKNILTQQKIDVVHAHQSSSVLGICYGIFSYHLGLKVVHTEHSLYGFKSMAEMCFCWTITPVFELYDRLICVSRATRNNLILRCHTSSHKTIVIPNAVMTPSPEALGIPQQKDINIIKIVVVSRMVYRRGIDVLISLLPKLCSRNRKIVIELVGDGPKLKPLQQMIKREKLIDRIILHGGKPNNQTLQIIKKCHIFLSTALTESFGIALVEAASLGLHVVSTNVGGVSEILPPHQLHAVKLQQTEIIKKLEEIIKQIPNQGSASPKSNTNGMYMKQQCFQRVIDVYKQVIQLPRRQAIKITAKNIFTKGSLPSLALLLILFLLTAIDFCTKSHKNTRKEND